MKKAAFNSLMMLYNKRFKHLSCHYFNEMQHKITNILNFQFKSIQKYESLLFLTEKM